MIRLTLCTAFLLTMCQTGAAAPVPAGNSDAAPVITAQTKPLGHLLEEIKSFARAAGGEVAVKEMEKSLEEKLGEKGFTGIDMLRPISGYANLVPKLEESWGVVVVPFTNEKDFLDLLERLEYKLKKNSEGVYEFTQLGGGLKGLVVLSSKLRMRFHDRSAYISMNAKEDAIQIKNLVPVNQLVDPADQAPIVVRMNLERLDPALKKQALDEINEWNKNFGNAGGGGPFDFFGMILKPLALIAKHYAEQVSTEGERITARLQTNSKTGEMHYELAIRGKKGSKFATEIAARKPTTSRFGGLFPESGVAGGLMQFPLFTKDLRDFFSEMSHTLLKPLETDVDEDFAPIIKARREGTTRAIGSGDLEIGNALVGPNADGLYTAIAALTYDDPTAVEKAIRDAVKKLPKPLQNAVKLDAAKVGDHSVHTVMVGSFLPPQLQKLVGENALLSVVFTPKAIYAAVGPNGLNELKRVTAQKPTEARAFDIQIHSKRFLEMMKKAGIEEVLEVFTIALANRDTMVSLQFVEIHGGQELIIRIGSTSFFPAGIFGASIP